MRAALTWILLGSLLLACGGEAELAGLDEPIRVIGGQFKAGALPGVELSADAGAPSDAGVEDELPRITSFDFATYELRSRQVGLPLGGRATDDTWSVAIAFEDLGSGYWVHSSGFEDPQAEGERRFDVTLSLGADVEPGPRRLLVVPIDRHGRAGIVSALNVCIASDLPDNGYACDATKIPPAAVALLTWNDDVDVDLIVRDSGGQEVGNDPSALAWHTSDASANCGHDGLRQEAVVWNRVPAPGLWAIYANLHDPCGHASVSYRLRYFVREEREDGSFELVDHQEFIGGGLLRAQANGGAKNPTFIVQVRF